MARFKIVKKGYSLEEVENYINNSMRSDKESSQDKSIRIDELKAEIDTLKRRIEEYKRKEDNVNDALYTAIEKAKEMDYATKIRFALEGERVKLFKEKWIAFCDKEKANLRIVERRGEITNQLVDIEREIVKTIANDLKLKVENCDTLNSAEKQYLSESKRILEKARNECACKNEVMASDFNLNELSNPPNLEELCKQLGLMG